MDFKSLKLEPALLRAVEQAGYEAPSPIQQKAIPPVLAGRDLLGCAQTGTGKTAAFALPILQLLNQRPVTAKVRPIRALILTPTRELALQIEESFETYGKYLPLRETVIFGGVGQNPQVAALKKGVDVLVATPGRLNDLIGQGYIDLSMVEIFVLDEADRMLDMGFVHDVKKVLTRLPQKKQTLLFSATIPKEIAQLASSLLKDPAKVYVTPQATTVERIDQRLYKVDKLNKRHLLASLLQQPGVESALVFTRTKHGADRVVRELGRAGTQAVAIHGNKSQNARQNALARFKARQVQVLVATDIAARGLDINELSHVFNYDLPNIPETYVHRIGRTGRAGHGGTAISFCCADELEYLADIEKLIGLKIPETTGHAWPLGSAETPPPAAAQPPRQKQGKSQNNREGNQAEMEQKNTKNKKRTRNAKPAAQAAAPAPKQDGRQPAAKKQNQPKDKNPARRQGGKPGPRTDSNPYENRTGGAAIITKKPAWSSEGGSAASSQGGGTQGAASEGATNMAKNNRHRGGRGRNKKKTPVQEPAPQQVKAPVVPKNPGGLFDFSEAELAEDTGIKVVSRSNGEVKYASFEDYLKDH